MDTLLVIQIGYVCILSGPVSLPVAEFGNFSKYLLVGQ